MTLRPVVTTTPSEPLPPLAMNQNVLVTHLAHFRTTLCASLYPPPLPGAVVGVLRLRKWPSRRRRQIFANDGYSEGQSEQESKHRLSTRQSVVMKAMTLETATDIMMVISANNGSDENGKII